MGIGYHLLGLGLGMRDFWGQNGWGHRILEISFGNLLAFWSGLFLGAWAFWWYCFV